jgi:hypothetical protein
MAQFSNALRNARGGQIQTSVNAAGLALMACLTLPAVARAQNFLYPQSTTIAVGTSSGLLFQPQSASRIIQICTQATSTADVWLNPTGGAAVVGSGVPVWAGGGCTNFGTVALPMPNAQTAITAISVSAQSVSLVGG